MDCGFEFEESELYHWEEPHGERLSGCPNCHGDYEELNSCIFCGEYEKVDEYLKVCDKCSFLMRERLADLVKKEFTKDEREFFYNYYKEGLFWNENK